MCHHNMERVVTPTRCRGSVSRGPQTPNVFSYLGVNGLNEDGDVTQMKVKGNGLLKGE
jgi:hypothetical protein